MSEEKSGSGGGMGGMGDLIALFAIFALFGGGGMFGGNRGGMGGVGSGATAGDVIAQQNFDTVDLNFQNLGNAINSGNLANLMAVKDAQFANAHFSTACLYSRSC